jgi:hypothetical protein
MLVGSSPEENELKIQPATHFQLLLVGGNPASDLRIAEPFVKMGFHNINIVSFDCCFDALRLWERINPLLPTVLVAESSAWLEDTENWTELEVREILYVKQQLEKFLGKHVYAIALLVGIESTYAAEGIDDVVQMPIELPQLLKSIIRGVQQLEGKQLL